MESEETVLPRVLLESLPPPDQAPILEKLGTLGFQKFRNEYAINTPVHPETGIVDHDELVRRVGAFVLDTYKWKAPFFDEHHLHWTARRYGEHEENPALADEFRDLPIHKLWVPRQFHDFIHLMTLPPDVPSIDVMRQSVKNFRRNNYLYTIATSAIELGERTSRMKRYHARDGVIFIDPTTKRVTRAQDSYDTRRKQFVRYIERHHRKGLLDLSELAHMDLRGADNFEEHLPEIQSIVSDGIVRSRDFVARAVELPIDRAA